jgi:pimeloyl-ACP methyl ester carboxylesterase
VSRVILYLHGFASSPESFKGRAYEGHLVPKGWDLRRLDLRLPNRDELRVSAMIEHVIAETEAAGEVAIIGSSLGGLVAAHVAARRPEVQALVLMAPAFRFAVRWPERIGAQAMECWRSGEPLLTDDHAGGPPLRVDYGFYEDAVRVDARFPGVEVPTLVFHGENDETVDIAGSRAFVQQTSRARLVELDDGHALVDSLPVMLPEAQAFLDDIWRNT